MKKLIIFAAAALMMAGCGQKTAKGGDNDTTATAGIAAAEVSEDVRMKPLKTDTVSFDKQEGIYKFGLMAEYPVLGGDIDDLPLPDFEPYLTAEAIELF